MLVSEFAQQIRREYKVNPSESYKLLGMRLEGRGIFHRETKKGFECSSNYLYQVHEGDFIYSRLFAWRGSFGIVSAEFDGYFVSNEFPTFIIDRTKVLTKLLLIELLKPKTLSKIEEICSGTTKLSRNRLKESHFLNLNICFPDIRTQRSIVNKIETMYPKIMAIKDLSKKIGEIQLFTLHPISPMIEAITDIYKLGDYITECNERIGRDWNSAKKIGVNKDSGIEVLRSSKKTGYEKYKIVRKGYIIYNPMRVNIGPIAMYDEDELAITSPDYVVFKPSKEISSDLILAYLKSPQGLKQINNNTRGAVRERLYYNNLCKIEFDAAMVKYSSLYDKLNGLFKQLIAVNQQSLFLLDKLERSVLNTAFQAES